MRLRSIFYTSIAACVSSHAGIVADNGLAMNGSSTVSETSVDSLQSTMRTRPYEGTKRVLLVVGHWNNATNLDPEEVRQQVFSNNPRSLRSFVIASSENKLRLDEFKTLVADFGSRPDKNCTNSDMYQRAANAISVSGIKSDEVDHMFVVVKCQGGANAHTPGDRAMFFGMGSSSHAFLHEFGHNLGISHPRTYKNCRKLNNTIFVPDGCSIDEKIADSGDPVGGGSGLYPAVNRAFSGWLDERKFGEIKKTGIYKIGVLGKGETQLFTIRRARTDEYINIEYRQPNPPYDFPADDNRSKGLWIRYSTVGSRVTSILVNANPADISRNTPTLTPGNEMADLYAGVKIRTCSVDKDGALFVVALNNEELPDCNQNINPPMVTVPLKRQEVLATPMIAGTGIPGAKINVVKSHDPGNVLGTTVVDAQGKWRVLVNKTLPEGNYSISSLQYLNGKTSSWGLNNEFVVKDKNISPPEIIAPLPNVATSRYPVVSGKAAPGATVNIVISHSANGIADETVVDERGNWEIKITKPVPSGTVLVSARQSLGGKVSKFSDNLEFKVTNTMSAPIIQRPANGAIVHGPGVVIAGVSLPRANIVVTRTGKPEESLGHTEADSSGRWEVTLPAETPAGKIYVSARLYDNGLISTWAINRVFTIKK